MFTSFENMVSAWAPRFTAFVNACIIQSFFNPRLWDSSEKEINMKKTLLAVPITGMFILGIARLGVCELSITHIFAEDDDELHRGSIRCRGGGGSRARVDKSKYF